MRLHKTFYPWALWLCFIWALSSIPSKDLPSIKIFSFDKIAHICVYTMLGVLINPWLKQKGWSRKMILCAYIGLLLLAALDETHQSFIPGRSVNVFDWIANGIGLSIGYLLYFKTT